MERGTVTAYIGLGANLGDAAQTLRQALDALKQDGGISLVRSSSLYRSAPIQATGPDFVNAVAQVSTTRCAPELLRVLQGIETAFGRDRPHRNAPRTLDLDLLMYGDARIESDSLQVPHPRMMERAFVLVPLAEVAPHRVASWQLHAVASQVVEKLPRVHAAK